MANIIKFCTGVGNLSNPYFVYIKKVFNWIGELSEEVYVSKTRLFWLYRYCPWITTRLSIPIRCASTAIIIATTVSGRISR